jgi:hypothetical protein
LDIVKNSIIDDKVSTVLTALKAKFSYSYFQRMKKVLNDFDIFVSVTYEGKLDKDNFSSCFAYFRDVSFREQQKSVASINDDLMALRKVLRYLMTMKAIPKALLPPNLRIDNELLKTALENPLLGSLNPKKWKSSLKGMPIALLQSVTDDEYLSKFIDHIRLNRDVLLEISRKYVTESNLRWENGQRYIQEKRNRSSTLFESPEHLTKKVSGKGQALSLFSDKLPNSEGLKNLVSYLHYKQDGLIVRDFTGSNNHLYRFGGRVKLAEHLGISSEAASACSTIIVAETGINPESLYKAQIQDKNGQYILFVPKSEDENSFYLTFDKPRARKQIKKLVKSENIKINAAFCIDYILKATQNHRAIVDTKFSNYLFLTDTIAKQKLICPLSHTSFKKAFHRLVYKALDDFDNLRSFKTISTLIQSKPNLSKLRKTGGVLKWYDSGGDPRAASAYLGNTTKVAIKNYIPRELQAVLYSKQIRTFQHVLISVATDEKSYQQEALGLKSSVQLVEYLESLSQQDINWSKIKNVGETSQPNKSSSITVVLTESNVAFLYAAYIAHNEILDSGGIKNVDKRISRWASIALTLMNKIRSSSARVHQNILVKGIALYKSSPKEYI